MMKNFRLRFLVSAAGLFLASCFSPVQEAPKATPAAMNTVIPTLPLVEPTPTATATLLPPSPTPLPSIKTQCVDNSSNTLPLDLDGVVALEKPLGEMDFQAIDVSGQTPDILGFYLLDPKTKIVTRTDNVGQIIKTSPDKRHLAYTYDTPDDYHFIRIVDSNGDIVADFADFSAYPDGVFEVDFNWLNPEQIRIVDLGDHSNVYPYLFNPFTQERMSMKTDWKAVYNPTQPNPEKVADWKFDREATNLYFVYDANILYDPTLTRVLYPKENEVVSLVDAQSEAELAHANFTDWGRLPQWSPDGENLVIVNREGNADEFYLVNHNGGEFERVTNFASEFDYATIPDFIWSPDGSRIAFWLELDQTDVEDGPQSELAILDIPTRQVTRLCIGGISNNAYEPWVMNHPEPIWSPDSKYVLITQWTNPDEHRNYDVLVVDPVTGSVEQISRNTAPIGWMVETQ